jgi:hypothetical protein
MMKFVKVLLLCYIVSVCYSCKYHPSAPLNSVDTSKSVDTDFFAEFTTSNTESAIAFSPDGSRIMSWRSKDIGYWHVRDTKTGIILSECPRSDVWGGSGPTGHFSPDNSKVIAVGFQLGIPTFLYDVTTPTAKLLMEDQNNWGGEMLDDGRIIVASDDSVTEFSESGSLTKTIHPGISVYEGYLNPRFGIIQNENAIIYSDFNNTLRIRSLDSDSEIRFFNVVHSLIKFSEDGLTAMAVKGYDTISHGDTGAIYYNTATGQKINEFPGINYSPIFTQHYFYNSTVVNGIQVVKITNIATGTSELKKIPQALGIGPIIASRNEEFLAVTYRDRTDSLEYNLKIRVWKLK